MAQNSRMSAGLYPSDPAVGPGVVITAATSNLVLNPHGRYVVVSTAGTITGQLVGDTGDVAYVLPVGVHPLSFKSITSVTSLVGAILR